MEFSYSVEHHDFRDSLRRCLSRAGSARRSGGFDKQLWRLVCAQMDIPGLHVPTQYGGAGGSLVETAIAFEEAGRSLASVPLLTTTLALEAVLRMGDDHQRSRLLPGLLSGDRVGSLAWSDCEAATVHAESTAGGTALTGHCTPVLNGDIADLFVVPADAGDGLVLHVVAADAQGVSIERLASFDGSRPVACVRLANAPAEPLAAGEPDDIERLLDLGRVMLAAEMLGGAEACLTLAVEYACRRSQFDRPIGSFQAVKHACADMMIEIDATRAAVMFAAMTAADGSDHLSVAAPLAKAQAADTYLLCAGSAIQVHGGIAFTWEHDLHLYFRRAQTSAALFGGSARHRALVADRAGL